MFCWLDKNGCVKDTLKNGLVFFENVAAVLVKHQGYPLCVLLEQRSVSPKTTKPTCCRDNLGAKQE